MSQIDIFYEEGFSTRSIVKESGWENTTNLAKCSPTDLFAASLGACMLTVMGMAAEKMGIDFQGARAQVHKEMTTGIPRRISPLQVHFTLPIAPNEEVRAKLEKIAESCPVHNSLHPEVRVELSFQWGEA